MPQERPIFEDEVTQRLPHIISISHPMPIPDTAWNEEPTRCLRVNAKWASYILGVMDSLDQPDAWIGSDAEIFDARQQIREIMLQLMSEDTCETMPPEYLKGIVGCENGTLEFTRVLNGEEESLFLDLASCLPAPPQYVQNIAGCESGIIEITTVNFDVPSSSFLNLSSCLEGEFARPGDIPAPTYTPIPSIIDGHLWFDTNDDDVPDLDTGQVVGTNGTDGTDGTNAPLPVFQISGTHLFVDNNADDIYDDLGVVVGQDGLDGICEVCEAFPPPELEEEDTDGLRCSVAINEAKFLRGIWDKAYNDTDDIINGYVGGIVTGATVLAYFFPGAAVGAAITGFALSLFKNINALESNAFDNDAEERYRCLLYCLLDGAGEVNFTEEIRDLWAAAIRMDVLNPFANYVGDLVEYSPLTEFQWVAYASSEVSAEACAECGCDEPEECFGSDTINVIVTNGTEYTVDFTLPEGCCYQITWDGEVRVGGTAGSPLMGDGNRQQISAGNWGTGGAVSGDILQWNAGSGGWTRLPTTTPYNPAGYSISVPSEGVALKLRWFAANYTNNSGTMTVTVEGQEC